MVKHVLIVTAFRLNECMAEVAAYVFAELNVVVDLHTHGCFIQVSVLNQAVNRAVSAEKWWHEGSIFNQDIPDC